MNPKALKWIKRILIGLVTFAIVVLVTGYIVLIAHKKEVHELITSTFNEKLSGQLVMKDLDFTVFEQFPHFTVRIEKVFVTDSASAVRGDTVFTAGKISIGVNLLGLLTGSIQFSSIKISDASIYMVKDSNGVMNTPKARVAPAQTTEKKETTIPSIKKIVLNNVSFHMMDSLKGKKFGLTFRNAEFNATSGSAPMSYQMKSTIHFDGLVFNPVKGGYLTDQDVELNGPIGFDPATATLTVTNGLLKLKNYFLAINVKMNFKEKSMHMRFDANSILPAVAYGALTPALQGKLKMYELQKPVMARVIINGFMKPGSKPAVDIYFKTIGNEFKVAGRSFENLDILGWFTTHVDSTKIYDDYNSKVVIPRFRGTYFGMPIESKIRVTNLKAPLLTMKARISYDGAKQGEVTTQLFKFFKGEIDIQYLFNGPLTNMIDSVSKTFYGDLSGSAVLKDVDFDKLSNGYEFRNVNGNISFVKPDLRIDSVSLSFNGNKMKITGSAQQVVAFILIPGAKAQATLNLSADTIDFNSFKGPPSADTTKKEAAKKSEASIPDLVYWISTGVEFNINLSAKRVIVQKFVATDIKANLVLDHDSLQINNAAMNTSGGNFLLNLSIGNVSGSNHRMSMKTSIKGVRMNDLLYSFNNFNQTTVTDQNITGTLSTNATLTATIDKKYNVIGPSMNGVLRTRVQNGVLKDLDGLDKVSNYVFRNRDFKEIQFADIANRTTLKGTMLDIDTLNVFSSVMTLFVSGIYDFGKKNTDLLITIPFSNLKKMKDSERMALSDSAARKGGNITLRASNTKDGDLKIAPVILGKKQKEPKEEKEKEKKKKS